MIPATCPICGMVTNCPDEMAGRQVPCSGCGTNITVAGAGDLGGGGLGAGGYGGYAAASPDPASKGSRSGNPWFMKWWVLALGGVAVVAIVVGMVIVASPKAKPPEVAKEEVEKPAEPKPAEKEEKPAPPKGPTIEPLEAITLEAGGTAKVTIKIQRGGVKEPIPLQLEGLPDQVTAEPVEIPEGKDTAVLVFTAAPEAPSTAEPAKVKILAEAGELKAEQQIAVTIKPPPPPVLSTIAALTLKPGGTATIEVKVDRKGFMGPITLAFEGLPEKVTARKAVPADGTAATDNTATDSTDQEATAGELTLAETESALKVALIAAADAAEATTTPRVTTTVREQKVEAPLKLTIERFSFRVRPLEVVTLKPGESKTIDVLVERKSYDGPFKLEPKGLPEKVAAAPLEIAAKQNKAQLKLTAAEDSPEQVKSASLSGKANNAAIDEALVVRVSKREGGFLPEEVSSNSELGRILKRGFLGGRQETASKQALLKVYGGTEASEAAVFKGLAWLARQQQEDGRWSFKESESTEAPDAEGDCQEGQQAQQGSPQDVSSTALGVLPFLGAGVTHESSPKEPEVLKDYRTRVFKAVGWIAQQQISVRRDPKQDGELPGGMTAHAMGTLAMCECFALTKDDRLKTFTQRAVKYLIQPQHAERGWRNESGETDDSRLGWVILAIRSAQLAGLSVDRSALEKAGKYLNTCAAGPEDARLSRYSLKPDEPANLTATAAGLLCREYLGWERDNSDLSAGCKYLVENLPSASGGAARPMPYCLFATHVLHNRESADWDKWNHHMREYLVSSQQKDGEPAGSWSPSSDDDAGKTDRLSATSMALLTLETYYRHLPLYKPTVKVADAK